MPLQRLAFRPGVNRESTNYANEGGYYDCEKIRFRSGQVEKIGGWTRLSNNTYLGTARAMWNWIDLDGANYLGVGTNLKYYLERGGEYYDITPVRATFDTPDTDNCFTTVNGSTTVTVTIPSNGAVDGDFVIFSGAVTVGGISAADLNAEFQITYVSPSVFTIEVPTAATSSATGGGALIVAAFQINTGLDVYVIGTGWGAGTWPSYINTTLTNPFTATGAGVTLMTVTQTAHGLTSGDYVYFQSISANPCGINRLPLQKAFEATVTGVNTYTISTVIGSTTYTTSSGAASGGTVIVSTAVAPLRGWGEAASVGVGEQLFLWSNDNFGQDLVIAPRGGSIYYWKDVDTISTRAKFLSALSTTAGFQGQFVPHTVNEVIASDIQRFVMALGANPYDAGDANTDFDPMLVRWSDQENPYQWVPEVTNQSGEFRLSHGSEIVATINTRQEILVLTDSAIYAMQYLGPPYVWGFTVLMDNISVMSPNSIITVNNITYWMGLEKFYMYSGRVETLPCTLRQYVFDDINQEQNYQVFAGSNEGYNEVWWFYCSQNSNVVDKYVIYNYLDNVWYYGTMSRSAWLDSGIRRYPMAATYATEAFFTGSIAGTTMTVTSVASGTITVGAIIAGAGIIANTTIASFGTGTGGVGTYIVNVPQSVDSTTISVITNSGRVLYHESSVDDVSGLTPVPINAYIQSSDFDIGDGHNFGFVWRILPDVNFNGSNVDKPTVTMTIKPRRNAGAPYGIANNPTVESQDDFRARRQYNIQEFDGQVYTRLRARQMSFRIESTGLGVAWQLGAPRIDIRPDGKR